MDRISTITLLVIVVAAVIALLLFGSFLKLINLDFNPFPTKPGVETPNGFEFLDMLGVVPQINLTEDGQPLTSSQISCKIAKDISSDFVSNGNYPHGASLPFSKDSIVGWGTFDVPWNSEKQRPVYYNDLSQKERDKLTVQSCSPCSPLLDEQCLTKQLSLREFSGQKICGTLSRFVHNSLETLKFGNSNCVSVGSQTFGTDSVSSPLQGESCSSLCGGEDKITVWQTDITNSSYLVSDKLEKGKSPPSLYPSSNTMLYLVKWVPYENPKEKKCGSGCKYNIDFLRIPKHSSEPSLSSGAVADQLSYYLKNFKRTEEAGSLIPELRLTEISDYSVTNSISIEDFVGLIQDKSGFDFDIGTCNNKEECIGKAASNITEYQQVQLREDENGNKLNVNLFYKSGGTQAAQFLGKGGINHITALSPLSTLDAGKTYTIYIFNWDIAGEFKEERQGDGKPFCFDGKRFYRKTSDFQRCSLDDPKLIQAGVFAKRAGALDRSIVILPAEGDGEIVGTDSCGNGVPLGDDCGKDKIEFDLRKEYTKLSASIEATFSSRDEVKVEFSTDRKTWKELYRTSGQNFTKDTTFIADPFRFVRLTGQGNIINTATVKVTG
ncbi:MAG: hypothetical protein HY362_03745 [Candidatus Aenigmarchaeota archaeon]|nr:hypothetical protein [Candidatus Aenigmarchaeota archaeon]